MSDNTSRRGFLAGAAAILSGAAGCTSRKDGEKAEVADMIGADDKFNVKENGKIFEYEGDLYGLSLIETSGEEARVEVGRYDEERYIGLHNGYLEEETDTVTVEPRSEINSSDIEGVENLPTIEIDDVDPGYVQVDLEDEVDYGPQ